MLSEQCGYRVDMTKCRDDASAMERADGLPTRCAVGKATAAGRGNLLTTKPTSRRTAKVQLAFRALDSACGKSWMLNQDQRKCLRSPAQMQEDYPRGMFAGYLARV